MINIKYGLPLNGDVNMGNNVSLSGTLNTSSRSLNGAVISNAVVIRAEPSYAPLTDKPQINFKTLEPGNNTYEYLGVEPTIIDITEQDIDNIVFG